MTHWKCDTKDPPQIGGPTKGAGGFVLLSAPIWAQVSSALVVFTFR